MFPLDSTLHSNVFVCSLTCCRRASRFIYGCVSDRGQDCGCELLRDGPPLRFFRMVMVGCGLKFQGVFLMVAASLHEQCRFRHHLTVGAVPPKSVGYGLQIDVAILPRQEKKPVGYEVQKRGFAASLHEQCEVRISGDAFATTLRLVQCRRSL
ncbi:hypothetical protein R1flu_018419 [Riccia fluitans]|uniref:Uncharacterized protein n=1 Tax=Riccia fluitans TaxID=41844 RepID=A0ABD1ZH92_9MARC